MDDMGDHAILTKKDQKEIKVVAWFSTKMLLWLVLGAIGIIVLITTGEKLIMPWWNALETRGTEHSYPAVSAKKELLLKLAQDYTKLDTLRVTAKADPELALTYRAQQRAIVDRMKLEAATLPVGEVPMEVRGMVY